MNEADDRLLTLLTQIYGLDAAQRCHPRLERLIRSAPIISPPAGRDQDIILIAYPDHLQEAGQSPLKSLHEFCQRHLKDVLNTVHILPFYPYTSDDGFAVSDYLGVNPQLGSWSDIKAMRSDFKLMFDGVFNHVSASHPWFQAFLKNDPKYRDYFIALDKTIDVSMVTRPRTSPLLIAFNTAAGQKYVWATFSQDQLDLNYANPEVLLEIIRVMLEYVRHGADFIRLDAIGYIWKQPGTPSIHLPRAHAIIRLMHRVLEEVAPWVRLVTETNVPHHENITYFGHGRDEAQMVYNFGLPPLLVHTMQSANTAVLSAWAATLQTPSDETAFFNFTASHDGIGVLGIKKFLSQKQIDKMCRRVEERGGRLSMRTAVDGSRSVYEMNITYFDAVTDPQADESVAIDQFLCSQAIALSLKGVPGIYLPSLIGARNWQEGVKTLGYSRAINRQKFQVKELEHSLTAGNRSRRILGRYLQLLKIRSTESAFSPKARQVVKQIYVPEVFAVERQSANSRVLALHNVTGKTMILKLQGKHVDLISGQAHKDFVKLKAYQAVWLKAV